MIYLDSSVLLAHLFDERRRPPPDFWDQPITSSTLLVYEVWNRIHALGFAESAGGEAARVLEHVDFVDLRADVIARALRPFPIAVRTLDALHLATMSFLRGRGLAIELASYDIRLRAAAAALEFEVASF